MGFSERIAAACSTDDLGAKDDKIRDVELVASLSGVTALGSDLMRAKDYDPFALRRSVLILAKKVRQKLRLGMGPAQAISSAAILEILHWQCRDCRGASEQIIGGIRKVCPTCGGVGVHRWSEKERAEACGYPINTWHAWRGKYEMVLGWARDCDSRTIGQAIKKLG